MPPNSFMEWVVGRNLPTNRPRTNRPEPAQQEPEPARRRVFSVDFDTDDESAADIIKVTVPRTRNAATPNKQVRFSDGPLKSAMKKPSAPQPSESEPSESEGNTSENDTSEKDTSSAEETSSGNEASTGDNKPSTGNDEASTGDESTGGETSNEAETTTDDGGISEDEIDSDCPCVKCLVGRKKLKAKKKQEKASKMAQQEKAEKKAKAAESSEADNSDAIHAQHQAGKAARAIKEKAKNKSTRNDKPKAKAEAKKPETESEAESTEASEPTDAVDTTASEEKSGKQSEGESETASDKAPAKASEKKSRKQPEVEVSRRSNKKDMGKPVDAKTGKKEGKEDAKHGGKGKATTEAVQSADGKAEPAPEPPAHQQEKSNKSKQPSRSPSAEICDPSVIRLRPVLAQVLQVEQGVKCMQDPTPNAFFDDEHGVVRVYHGPLCGDPHNVLCPRGMYAHPAMPPYVMPPFAPYACSHPCVHGTGVVPASRPKDAESIQSIDSSKAPSKSSEKNSSKDSLKTLCPARRRSPRVTNGKSGKEASDANGLWPGQGAPGVAENKERHGRFLSGDLFVGRAAIFQPVTSAEIYDAYSTRLHVPAAGQNGRAVRSGNDNGNPGPEDNKRLKNGNHGQQDTGGKGKPPSNSGGQNESGSKKGPGRGPPNDCGNSGKHNPVFSNEYHENNVSFKDWAIGPNDTGLAGDARATPGTTSDRQKNKDVAAANGSVPGLEEGFKEGGKKENHGEDQAHKHGETQADTHGEDQANKHGEDQADKHGHKHGNKRGDQKGGKGVKTHKKGDTKKLQQGRESLKQPPKQESMPSSRAPSNNLHQSVQSQASNNVGPIRKECPPEFQHGLLPGAWPGEARGMSRDSVRAGDEMGGSAMDDNVMGGYDVCPLLANQSAAEWTRYREAQKARVEDVAPGKKSAR